MTHPGVRLAARLLTFTRGEKVETRRGPPEDQGRHDRRPAVEGEPPLRVPRQRHHEAAAAGRRDRQATKPSSAAAASVVIAPIFTHGVSGRNRTRCRPAGTWRPEKPNPASATAAGLPVDRRLPGGLSQPEDHQKRVARTVGFDRELERVGPVPHREDPPEGGRRRSGFLLHVGGARIGPLVEERLEESASIRVRDDARREAERGKRLRHRVNRERPRPVRLLLARRDRRHACGPEEVRGDRPAPRQRGTEEPRPLHRFERKRQVVVERKRRRDAEKRRVLGHQETAPRSGSRGRHPTGGTSRPARSCRGERSGPAWGGRRRTARGREGPPRESRAPR